jgi:hypothetical protein
MSSREYVIPKAPTERLSAPRIATGKGAIPRFISLIERNALVVAIVAVYATVLLWRLSSHLQQDGWYGLVAGREIAHNGIPTRDELTVWSFDAQWIDQQWLAHLVMYALGVLGGVGLLLVVHAFILAATFGAGVTLARVRGASVRATAWIAVVALAPIIQGSWQLRAQTFAYPLFLAVLWLLVSDARTRSRRVFLVLPLLAVWANIHGSVLLGSALVGVRGLTEWRAKVRAICLIIGSVAAIFATPYGVAILDYYRATLVSPVLAQLVSEWQPTELTPWTVPVFVLVVGGAWLVGRHSRSITAFEQVALALTGALALLAVRHLAWFGIAALVILPKVLSELMSDDRRRSRRAPNIAIAVTTLAVAAVSVGPTLMRLDSSVESSFSSEAADVVAEAASVDSSLHIFADVRYGDWLLWQYPELRGRILYDSRFELLSTTELVRIFLWANQATDRWRSVLDGSRLLVLDVTRSELNETALLDEAGARRLYRDEYVSVITRRAPND